MTALEAVLFDLDGTLVDTLPVCYLAFRGALERVGGPSLTDAEIHALFGPSEEGMLQRVLPDRWQSALPGYLADYERLLSTCAPVVPDLAAAFALLRERGVRVALVTGKSPITAAMSVRHFGLEAMFDAVEAGSPHGVVKAAAIGRLLQRWQLTAEQAIYVGDAAADMHAAREAGVVAAGAAWAQGARAAELEAACADVVFTDTATFLAWLDTRTWSIRTS